MAGLFDHTGEDSLPEGMYLSPRTGEGEYLPDPEQERAFLEFAGEYDFYQQMLRENPDDERVVQQQRIVLDCLMHLAEGFDAARFVDATQNDAIVLDVCHFLGIPGFDIGNAQSLLNERTTESFKTDLGIQREYLTLRIIEDKIRQIQEQLKKQKHLSAESRDDSLESRLEVFMNFRDFYKNLHVMVEDEFKDSFRASGEGTYLHMLRVEVYYWQLIAFYKQKYGIHDLLEAATYRDGMCGTPLHDLKEDLKKIGLLAVYKTDEQNGRIKEAHHYMIGISREPQPDEAALAESIWPEAAARHGFVLEAVPEALRGKRFSQVRLSKPLHELPLHVLYEIERILYEGVPGEDGEILRFAMITEGPDLTLRIVKEEHLLMLYPPEYFTLDAMTNKEYLIEEGLVLVAQEFTELWQKAQAEVASGVPGFNCYLVRNLAKNHAQMRSIEINLERVNDGVHTGETLYPVIQNTPQGQSTQQQQEYRYAETVSFVSASPFVLGVDRVANTSGMEMILVRWSDRWENLLTSWALAFKEHGIGNMVQYEKVKAMMIGSAHLFMQMERVFIREYQMANPEAGLIGLPVDFCKFVANLFMKGDLHEFAESVRMNAQRNHNADPMMQHIDTSATVDVMFWREQAKILEKQQRQA
jgi:hypothetical protein